MNQFPMLDRINSPDDLDGLNMNDLRRLCSEVRRYIIQTISNNGGHLASNLGVVELTVMLHKIFDSPNDKIIWDVGHQCYTHKILTGRKDSFPTIRQEGGISGYPKPGESGHDIYISGHSTTSMSVACGIAQAEMLKGSDNTVLAVIGDGSFTGGMAYEAMNNSANLKNLVVILNNNEMSISKTVGSLGRYLSNLRAKPRYLGTKSSVESVLDHTPLIGRPLKKFILFLKTKLKSLLYRNNLFMDLSFSYLGPIDGHNLEELENALNWAKKTDKPAVIHVMTKKGKGYPKAEENPGAYHGVSNFDVDEGNPDISLEDSFSVEFGKELANLASTDKTICGVTAAMKYGTGMQYFYKLHKDRFFDVGIAEQHAVTFCGGLASSGMLPVFAVYSTFLQRGYDQIIHDIAIGKQHIVLAVDRAGVVGNDGETHQGIFDVSYLSSIPHTTIYSPANYFELRRFLRIALYKTQCIAAVRYPRGSQEKLPDFENPDADYQLIGEGDNLIITYGRISHAAIQAAEKLSAQGINTAVLKLNKIYPIPAEAAKEVAEYPFVYFFEEGIQSGGLGEKLLYLLNKMHFDGEYHLYAINDFIPQATVEQSLKSLGLDSESMVDKVKKNIKHGV